MKRYAQGGVHTQRYLSQDALDRLGIGWKGRIWFLCDGVTFWAMSLRNPHNWDILILKRCASYLTDRQSFARFWEVEIQQRALLKTWKDPFSSLFVANNKKWLEETSLIVEVEEETTSELGRQGPGAKRKKRSNADLKGALGGSLLPHGHLSGFIWPKVCEGAISGVYVHTASLITRFF